MELVGDRRGELEEMHVRGEYTHARFNIPARGLIGLRTRLLNATQGTAVIHHRFAGYKPMQGEVPRRANGVYDLDGHRQGQRLRPQHAAGAGRHVRRAQRRGLRRA